MIFFTYFDIKRLSSSENILLNGNFKYPIGYMQTIIIMYFEVIIKNIIPGIFIVMNNKQKKDT